jgi:hypothetical protein
VVVNLISPDEADKEISQWKNLDGKVRGANLGDFIFLSSTGGNLIAGYIRSISGDRLVLSHEHPENFYGGLKNTHSTLFTRGDSTYKFQETVMYIKELEFYTRRFNEYLTGQLGLKHTKESKVCDGLKDVDYGDLLILGSSYNQKDKTCGKIAGFVRKIDEKYVLLSFEHPHNLLSHNFARNRYYEWAKYGNYMSIGYGDIISTDERSPERKRKGRNKEEPKEDAPKKRTESIGPQ